MRGSIIRYMYYEIGDELLNKGLIPYIPKYKTMHNKHSWGLINKNYAGIYTYIAINTSAFNPDYSHFWSASTWFYLIDSICHEFAHMQEWEHGAKHTKLTFDYLVISYDLLLKDENLNKRIEFINSFDEFKNSDDYKIFFNILFGSSDSDNVVNESSKTNSFSNEFFNSNIELSFFLFIADLILFLPIIYFFIRPPPATIFY